MRHSSTRRTSRAHPESRATAPALACVLGLLLTFCAGCRSTRLPAEPLSESAVRLDLPLVRQDALYDCGLASISALCQYWRIDIPLEERELLARTAEDRAGLSGNEVRGALERLGFEVYLFKGSLDRTPVGLYGHVDAGRPPLVMVSSNGSRHHYELVLGYDESRSNLILLDPMKGEILVPVTLFERDWSRCERFTLLACPKQEVRMGADRQETAQAGPPLFVNP